MNTYKLAVVGATGVVGQTVLKILEEKKLPISEYTFFASKRSAGKTLKLYLNMDINTVDPKFRCHDMSDKKTYVTVPVLLRIKSGRAVKYAKRLIDQCAEQHVMLERRKPFVVDSIALIEEALAAKEGDNAEVEFDEIETLDDSAMTDSSEE